MNETLLAFLKRVSEDAGLKARVDELKGLSPEEMAARAAAIAHDAGFELTSEDFLAGFDESDASELDERELSAVGGGSGEGSHAAEGCICVFSGVHGDSIYYCVCLAGGEGEL